MCVDSVYLKEINACKEQIAAIQRLISAVQDDTDIGRTVKSAYLDISMDALLDRRQHLVELQALYNMEQAWQRGYK